MIWMNIKYKIYIKVHVLVYAVANLLFAINKNPTNEFWRALHTLFHGKVTLHEPRRRNYHIKDSDYYNFYIDLVRDSPYKYWGWFIIKGLFPLFLTFFLTFNYLF